MSLELTKVSVFPSTGNKINIGYGTATFNEQLQVKFNIRKSNAGVEFVSWPQSSYQKDGKTVYSNEVFIAEEVRDDINKQIITEFNKVLAVGGTQTTTTTSAPKDADPAPTTGGPASTKAKKPKVKTTW